MKKAADEKIIETYLRVGSIWKAAEELNMCGQSIHGRLVRLKIQLKYPKFSSLEENILKTEYNKHINDGTMGLLAKQLKRTSHFLCRKAKGLGMTNRHRSKGECHKKFLSVKRKKWYLEHPHPKGMLGKKHSTGALEKISAASVAMHRKQTKAQVMARVEKMMRTKVQRGNSVNQRINVSWRSGWRKIGGRNIFYRSKWEANWARYLQFLKEYGKIKNWEHEPKTFWFKNIKRGVCSYLPDFRVIEPDGTILYHEIKGWMDRRSITKIRRMKKYFPEIGLRVVRGEEYNEICKKLKHIIGGWEL